MTVQTQDKPLEIFRQEVIDQLILNYAHQTISRTAFERRLDEAHEATGHDSLTSLIADLERFMDSKYDDRRDHLLYADDDEALDSRWCVNFFSGTQSDHEEIVPGILKIVAIFGGANLDYSMARFSAPETQIKVLLLFGGAEIHVPEGVKIRASVLPLFGGCHNKGEPVDDPAAPVVTVTGIALFGGISIGVKRTLRERMHGFADDIRQMFS